MKKRITKEIFLYLLFGGLTTLINILLYSFLYYKCSVVNTVSNIAAWLCSVAFAYVTNRIWVFESRRKGIIREAVSFFGCRALTGLLDLAIMYLFVDILAFEGGAVKIAANVLVIILNYAFSKLYIFKKGTAAK